MPGRDRYSRRPEKGSAIGMRIVRRGRLTYTTSERLNGFIVCIRVDNVWCIYRE